MPKALFVTGLPGSGKSCYLEQLAGGGARQFDDFKANAIGNSSTFTDSRHLDSLVSALRGGQDCVVADIDFCRNEARSEAEDVIRELAPEAHVEWHCFENDAEQCSLNIRARGRYSEQEELRKLDELAPTYSPPRNGLLLRVWRDR